MKKNAKATSAFGATLKSVGANLGIMLAITLAVQLLAKAYDELVVTMEEQQEIVDGLKTDIDGLSAEYDILNKKGNLTGQEKARLEMLERQLELKKELLAIEQKELADKELRQDNQGLLNHKGVDQYSLDITRQSKQLDQVRDRINNGGYGGWVLDDYIQQEQDLMQSLEDNRISMMQELQYYSDRYDKIQANLDAGIYDGNPEEKANWENQLQIAKNKMGELQTLIDNTEFVLGVSIDVNVAKEHIKESVKGVSDEWLNSLSDEELTYLFRLDNIGEYTHEELKEAIDNLQKESKNPIEIKVTTADIITELDDMSEGFEKISEIYNDIKDLGDFDFSNLSKNSDFGAIFGETEGFEEFVDVVAKSPSDIKACQSAFDNLVSSWIDAQSPFENINEENKEAYINWLKSKGVINAVEYANYALAKSTGDLNKYLVSETDATYKAFLAGRDLKDITYEEITAFLSSAKASNLSTNALQMLQAQMVMVNNQKLNFSQQIGELMKIATAAGVATEMLSGRQLDRAARRNNVSSVQYLYNQLVGELNTLDVGVDFKPPAGGGGGSSSSKDPHIAEVDKYKTLTDAVDEYDRKLEKLERIYDNTDSIEERIGLKKAEIKLYQQQKEVIEELNNVRDDEIFDKVNLLRDVGFKIDYDSDTEQLIIHNREHINDLNQEIIEEYEDYIERIDELNDANKDSADQWDALSATIAKTAKEINDLEREKYEDYIEGAEHILRMMENRADAFGKESSVYTDMMEKTLLRWKDLVTTDYKGNIDEIRELEEEWMDFYDARIEREKEILEMQLDDNDKVLDGVIKVIDDEIKSIDDQIDSLSKANDERKEALELQKAQAELDKARNQKTRMVLRKGVGWVYEADEDAIRKAEENLADKQYDSKIDALEEEKEALEDLKEKWEEIPDVYENEQNKLLMIEKLGADAEEDILSGRLDIFDDFKDDYIDIQEQIQDKTDELEEHTSEAYSKMMKAFENMAKIAGIDLNQTTTQKTQSSWYVGKDGKAPSQAQIGDLVYTKGGTYKITGKDENGKFSSEKIDNVSTAIPEGMWGKKFKETVVGITDNVTDSVDDIVNSNKELIDSTKKQILTDANLQKYISDNTKYTADEVAALLENADISDMLSDYTDENSDATDDNTRALYDFIDALANLEFEIPLEELPEDPFAELDWGSMTPDEKSYINQLQEAYRTAIEQGNDVFANGILGFLQDFKDGLGDEYIQIGKDALAAATTPYGKTSNSKVDDDDRLVDFEKQLERAKANGDSVLINKLEDAIAVIKYGSGYEKDSNSNGYITQSIISAVNAAESFMTADELKQKYEYDNGATDNGFDYGKMGEIIASRVQEAIDNPYHNDWNIITNDFGELSKEVQLDDLREIKETLDNVYNKDTSNLGVTTGSNSGSSSGSNKTSGQKAMDNHGMSDSDKAAIKDAQNRYNSATTQAEKDKAHADAEAIRNKYGYSGGDDGSKDIVNSNSKVTKSLDNSADASTYSGDASYDLGDSIADSADKITDATSNLSVDVNVNVSGGTGSTGKGKGGNPDDPPKTEYTYRTDNNPNSPTFGVTLKEKKEKKAKGGRNLVEDIYNVDEKGRELLIQPTQGRYVHLSAGSDVIPADITDVLWKFGQNPSGFVKDLGIDYNKSIKPVAMSSNNAVNYNISKVEMHGVDDWMGFMNELQHLPMDANQYSYIR